MQLKIAELQSGLVSYRLLGEGPRKVLFFHGFPGSSSQLSLFQSFFTQLDLQVLCFDRPGYNKTLVAHKDILGSTIEIACALTEKLTWSQFEIVTVSGGTPYGISFAQKFPEKVSEMRVICGLGYIQNPQIKAYFKTFQLLSLHCLKYIPGRLIQWALKPERRGQQNKRSRLFEFFYPTSPADRSTIFEKSLGSALDFALTEAVNQNALGPVADSKVFLSHWGKELAHFSVPIHFYHGDEDLVIPFQVSKLMSKLIPGSRFTLISGEGHISLPTRRTAEILSLPV